MENKTAHVPQMNLIYVYAAAATTKPYPTSNPETIEGDPPPPYCISTGTITSSLKVFNLFSRPRLRKTKQNLEGIQWTIVRK